MVSNQDGLGTDSFPEDTFWPVHNFIIQTLESEGIHFSKQHIDRHFPEDNSPMRKPGTGMLTEYIDNPATTWQTVMLSATVKPMPSLPKTWVARV